MSYTGVRCLALALALGLGGIFAASGAWAVDKPAIQFAPGASSATVKGEIAGMDRDTYAVTAKAGQTMSVSVKNKAKLVLFHIQTPEGEGHYLPGAGEEDDATTFTGKLPASGKYVIIVGAMKGNDTRYELTVSVKN